MFWEVWNTRRWIQVLSDPQQLNAYSYARNNPILYVDPSGEVVETIWDIWNVWYDLWVGVKNIWEILWWSIAYTVWFLNNDDNLKNVAKQWIKWDVKDLKKVWVDLWTDTLATMIPLVPAWGSKIAKIVKNNSDEIWKWTKEVIKYTSKQYSKIAENLWYKEIKWQYSNWQKIYYNNKSKKYISWDVDKHNWWVWKMADTIKWLGKKETRLWTYDKNLNKIWD